MSSDREASKVRMIRVEDCKNTLAYIGSVDNVINGVVPEDLRNRRFSAAAVRYGFELGSPQGICNLGECIIFNGLIYSSRTDPTRKERDPLMWGPEYVTPGIFLIPGNARPNWTVSFSSLDEEIALSSIYSMIYEKTSRPFAVLGCAELAKMRARSVTHPPIEHENLFSHESKYFEEKEENDEDVSIAFMGAVAKMGEAGSEETMRKLRSVLYCNPFNLQKEGFLSHTHAAVLTRPLTEISRIHPQHVCRVAHLMDDSLIRWLKAEVYEIFDLAEYGGDCRTEQM